MTRNKSMFLTFIIAFFILVLSNVTLALAKDIEYPKTNEAVVYTSAGLKTALTSANITKIYLGADIKVTQSDIVVNTKSRQEFTIDGINPYSGSNTIHTLEEYNKSVTAAGATIRITAKGVLQKFTLKNLNIIGNNWYGIVCVYNGINGITQEVNNVKYVGPQPVHNRAGFLILDNVDITIKHGLGAKNADNVAEIKGVTFRNSTNIVKQELGEYNELFWVTETAGRGYINMEPGAVIKVDNTAYTVGYRSGFVHGSCAYDFTIGDGVTFDYKGTRIFWQNLAVENFNVGKNAKVNINILGKDDKGTIDWPVLRVKTSININNGADFNLVVQNNTTKQPALELQSATMNFYSPSNLLIYNDGGDAILTDSSSSMDLTMNKLAFYEYASSNLSNLGNPKFVWKNNSGDFRILATTKSTGAMKTFTSYNYNGSGSSLNINNFYVKGIKVISSDSIKEPVQYALIFEPNNGLARSGFVVKAGDTINKPNDPIRAGYTFGGWTKTDNGTDLWDFANDRINDNTILYAKWIQIVNHTVTFDLQGGTGTITPQTIPSGGLVTKPTDPTRTGYTFAGWTKTNNGTDAWNFATDKVTGNITLYAKWTQVNYQVTFDLQGGTGTITPQTIPSGGLVTKPTDPTRVGYIFGGWTKTNFGTDFWDFATDKVTGNTTLYAKWNNQLEYTVKFDADGGTPEPNEQKIKDGGKVAKPTDPTKEGYTFEGWYTDNTFKTKWNFANKTVTTDLNLIAKWIKVGITYKVDFIIDDANNPYDTKVVNKDSLLTEPTKPTKAGYTFEGWAKNKYTSIMWDFSNDKVTSDTNLYAKFTKKGEAYTVTFVAKGGSNIPSSQTVESGNFATNPKPPTKAGDCFSGWFADTNFENRWIFSRDKVYSDITLYGKWCYNN